MTYVLAPVTDFLTKRERGESPSETWTIFKDAAMRKSDIVFESTSRDKAVQELTRLRLSCSNGTCED
jgi:hypothetical protein